MKLERMDGTTAANNPRICSSHPDRFSILMFAYLLQGLLSLVLPYQPSATFLSFMLSSELAVSEPRKTRPL